MKVAPAGRVEGAPADPASATPVIMFPRMVMTWLRRAELDTPSISTPARISVTGAVAGSFFCAQLTEIRHRTSSRTNSRTIQRFTLTSGKVGLYYSAGCEKTRGGEINRKRQAGVECEERILRERSRRRRIPATLRRSRAHGLQSQVSPYSARALNLTVRRSEPLSSARRLRSVPDPENPACENRNRLQPAAPLP